MTIRSFISVILVIAALIVAAVDLSHRSFRRPPVVIDFPQITHAGHYFIADDRTETSIDCELTALDDWNEIWEHDPNPCSLGDGWLLPQSSGSSVFGTRAEVQIELPDEAPRTLAMRLKAFDALSADVEQSVRILVNGRDLGQHPVSRKWHSVLEPIPPDFLHVGRNDITLEFSHAISRRQVTQSNDNHAIAAKIDRLAILTPTDHAQHANRVSAPTSVWDNRQQTFAVRQSGTLVLPLVIPQGADEIEFELQPSRSVDLSTLEVVIDSEDLDGRHRQQAAIKGPLVRDRGRIGLSVGVLSGRWALVTAEISITSGQLLISPPKIIMASEQTGDSVVRPTRDDPETPPDIIMITLDAARADRFSHAGYHRDTTPFINRFASESLVFPNAFALAPYTLCSVPTMITGQSFLDHGVVYHEDVLDEEAVTLAETLKERGYRTACFSSTPNNSRSKGFSQGYDVFREIWKEAPGRQGRRAHYLAKQVVDWLDTTAGDDDPLHLQIHMIPPHGPYDPPKPHDLFTDPSYDGPCNGFNQTISTIDGREIQADDECIAHLSNLYDGNLRVADAATRTIVLALQRRPRWKDTVVLITSDHGEAFMEHGMLGHNSTVYREMLHVPFVLRLPPNQRGRRVDTNRLVTLADIVPTLLGAAGAPPTGDGEGVDLLAPASVTGGRFMIARTTEKRPYLGLRSLRWSLILNRAGPVALHDLAADPGELDNVAYEQPALVAGLGRILTHRIAQPPQLAVSGESADITDEDRELLEALGYVRD